MPRFRSFDGLSLYYTDSGSGVPILCLSGLTRDHRDFDYVTPHLEHVRLIKLDYRGRGQSDWAPDFDQYTIQTEAEDVQALLDHLGLGKAAILGTSRGGLIALWLAATARDRLSGAALVDIGPALEDQGMSAIMSYLGRPPQWASLAEAAKARAALPGFANVPPARWRAEVEKLYVQTDKGLQLSYDPRLRDAVAQMGALPPGDLWAHYDALAALPLALIRSANSDLLSAATFAQMRRRAPRAVATEVPDRAHIPFLDEPEAVDTLHAWTELLE